MEHRKPSVVVVDDYPLFRKGIADALTTNANFQILGLTGDEKTALSLIGLKPDLVIIDLDAKGFLDLGADNRSDAEQYHHDVERQAYLRSF